MTKFYVREITTVTFLVEEADDEQHALEQYLNQFSMGREELPFADESLQATEVRVTRVDPEEIPEEWIACATCGKRVPNGENKKRRYCSYRCMPDEERAWG